MTMASPSSFCKESGFGQFLVSHKLMAFIIFAITCVALYHVKISLGDNLWKSNKSAPDFEGKITMNDYILDYFKTGRDAGLITWAHAVNNKRDLDTHLKGEVMMLEADVQVDKSGTAIMAHPPETTSDLTLDHFMANSLTKKKGVKLDFKTPQAADAGLRYVSTMSPETKNRVLINADILTGTGAEGSKFVADEFLGLVKQHAPHNLLSLGWTLGLPRDNYKGGYDSTMVQAMHDSLVKNQVTQPITFAVEATYTVLSIEELGWLLSKFRGSSLTVWFSKHSRATAQDMICLRKKFGKDRVFLDLPQSIQTEFNALLSDKQTAGKC